MDTCKQQNGVLAREVANANRDLDTANKDLSSCKGGLSTCEEEKSALEKRNQHLLSGLNDCRRDEKAEKRRRGQCEAREEIIQGQFSECSDDLDVHSRLAADASEWYKKEETNCRNIIMQFNSAQNQFHKEAARRQNLYDYFYWTGMLSNPADESPPKIRPEIRFCLELAKVDPFLEECSDGGTRTMNRNFCLAKQLQAARTKALDEDKQLLS